MVSYADASFFIVLVAEINSEMAMTIIMSSKTNKDTLIQNQTVIKSGVEPNQFSSSYSVITATPETKSKIRQIPVFLNLVYFFCLSTSFFCTY